VGQDALLTTSIPKRPSPRSPRWRRRRCSERSGSIRAPACRSSTRRWW